MIGISFHHSHQTERSEVVYVEASIESLLRVVAFAKLVEADAGAVAIISINNVRLTATPFDWRRISYATDAVRIFA